MKLVCPYCKQPMNSDVAAPLLSQRKARIYRAVLYAGPEGIPPDDLLVRMYDENEWPTPGGFGILRVQIHEINKVLQSFNQCIISRPRRRYRLVSLKEVGSEEAQDEQASTNH